MLERLKRSWQQFKAGSPGRRFQQQFSRRRSSASSPIHRALFVSGGVLLSVSGLFFLFVPGPGLAVLLVGAFLIAQQSLRAARALDWSEIQIRKLLTRSLRVWRRSSPVLKLLLVVFALAVAGVVGFGALRFIAAQA